jgi:hypothetical protein
MCRDVDAKGGLPMREVSTTPQALGMFARLRARWSALDAAWRWALALFLGYRVLLSFWFAWVSAVFPQNLPEQLRPVWPISAPLGAWLERVLLWPTLRYDVLWNVGIAEQGYAYRLGSTAFHPLYPLLIGGLGRVLGGNYLLTGWLIAQVCCIAMLALLYKLVLLDYDVGVAQRTTLFLIGSPLGFIFLVPYAESLLLLCIVGAFYAARRGRWVAAGLAGAAAALTKQPGVVVLAPLAWELWRAYGADLRAGRLRPLLWPIVGIALVPLGLLAYLVYRATLGDVEFSWRSPSTFIWAVLVTPSYDRVWDHHFSWPWVSLIVAFERLRAAPFFYLILNTFGMLIMAVIVCYGALRQRGSYVLYSLCLLIMNLSIVYPFLPYISVLRRFTIIFPLFIQLALWGRSRRAAALILGCNTLLWVYISEAYVRGAYLP